MRGHVEMDILNVHYVHNRRFYFAEFKRERDTMAETAHFNNVNVDEHENAL